MKEQLLREIKEMTTPELLECYNPGNHVFTRHYQMSEREMKARIRKAPVPSNGELLCISRFTSDNKAEIAAMVAKCLLDESDTIMKWYKLNPFQPYEAKKTFDHTIGEGIVKGTDWNHLFPLSKLYVVIRLSDIRGRLFQIVTAYPAPSFDEVDDIYDAIDAWTASLEREDT